MEQTACWIEETFRKCECVQFVANQDDPERCGCGRDKCLHELIANNSSTWSWKEHTVSLPTDAYGTIEFVTSCVHAPYVRISPDTDPIDVIHLLIAHWGVDPPNLVVTIHGGLENFELPQRVKRAFRRSLQKMASVPGCWIITIGINSGIAKLIGEALTAGSLRRNRAIVIGVAPWGVIVGRELLQVRNESVRYLPPPTSPGATVLNPHHSFFLLVDDGSVGKFGFEIEWRKHFLRTLCSQNITSTVTPNSHHFEHAPPLVGLLVEGGAHCIRLVDSYLSESQPVVVIADSGRSADVLSLAVKLVDSNNSTGVTNDDTISQTNPVFDESDLSILNAEIQQAFGGSARPDDILNDLVQCMKNRRLLTICSVSAESPRSSLDVCFLSALLRTKERSAPDQFRLALAWNRVDLAKDHIFVDGQSWPDGALGEAMIDALVMDRVEFVKLLLEKGVNMAEVLTYDLLVQLYNTKHDDAWLLHDIASRFANREILPGNLTLADVGLVIDNLMGFGYRTKYTRRAKLMRRRNNSGKDDGEHAGITDKFSHPFAEILVWSVVMQRQNMARLMCTYGREMLAKCLFACCLYRSMANYLKSEMESEVEMETSDKLTEYGNEFAQLAVDFLDKCHLMDEVMAQQLLTLELVNFNCKTCLSLAVTANHKHLVAHPCCQRLLDELWMGGLRANSARPWKILLGLLCPIFALFGLEYLTHEELRMQPQTEAELHEGFRFRLDDAGRRAISPNRRLSRFYSVLSANKTAKLKRDASYSCGEQRNTKSSTNPLLNQNQNEEINDDITANLPALEAAPVNGSRIGKSVSLGATFIAPKCFQIHGEVTAEEEGRSVISATSTDSSSSSSNHRRRTEISLRMRFDEFYNAPVTKFCLHSVGYAVFIVCYCYTILTESSLVEAQWPEVYMTAYVITSFFDVGREIVMIDARGLRARLATYFLDVWNIFDVTAILLFLIGLPLRWMPAAFETGRALWIVAIVFFILHTFCIFQANQDLATYISIITEMLKRMISFLIILGVAVAMYGIVLQATRFPYRKPSWAILKGIWIEPFFNLYGEAYHEFVDTGMCDAEFKNSTDREKPPCWCCTWIGPVAQAVFLVIANILMLNLLVAVFNSVYESVNRISKDLIRFQRYRLIVHYQSLPILPPPFVIISHIFYWTRALIRRIRKLRVSRDPGLLKVVLNGADLASLYEFEEQARIELLENREAASVKPSMEEKLKVTGERIESIQMCVKQIADRQAGLLSLMRDFEIRLTTIDHSIAANYDNNNFNNNSGNKSTSVPTLIAGAGNSLTTSSEYNSDGTTDDGKLLFNSGTNSSYYRRIHSELSVPCSTSESTTNTTAS